MDLRRGLEVVWAEKGSEGGDGGEIKYKQKILNMKGK